MAANNIHGTPRQLSVRVLHEIFSLSREFILIQAGIHALLDRKA